MQLSIKNVDIMNSAYKLYIRTYTATYSLGKYNSRKQDWERTVRM